MNWRTMACLCVSVVLALSAASGAGAGNLTYTGAVVDGVPLKIVWINLKDPNIKVTGALTQYGPGHSESFRAMVRRAQPTVAITGTFFCNYSLKPIGDIVIDGKLAHFGGLGTAFCVTDDNEVEFRLPPRDTHQDWSAFDFVLCSGPRLIRDGVAYVEPWSEGFHDRHMLNRNGRLAIGVTRENQMVIVATRKPIYLSRLARVMRSLGVVDAINLDGGSSIGLYYKGKMLMTPGRSVTNAVLIYGDREQYDRARAVSANRVSRAEAP